MIAMVVVDILEKEKDDYKPDFKIVCHGSDGSKAQKLMVKEVTILIDIMWLFVKMEEQAKNSLGFVVTRGIANAGT